MSRQQLVDYVQWNHARKHGIAKRFQDASYGLDALKRRGSASICAEVVPSKLPAPGVIDVIHAGVKIAWTAMKLRVPLGPSAHVASQSSENDSRQYRESSCNIRNSRKVHRSNCSNALFDATKFGLTRVKEIKKPQGSRTLRLLSQFLCRLSLERRRDQSSANRPCLRNKHDASARLNRSLNDFPCLFTT